MKTLLAAALMLAATPALAAKCTWRAKGKVVDATGAPATVKLKIDARWAKPPAPWNDLNWADPTTKKDGRFDVKSKSLLGCKKLRDVRIKARRGSKWVEVAKKRSKGKTVDFGTLRLGWISGAGPDTPPRLGKSCPTGGAVRRVCKGGASKCLGRLTFGPNKLPYYRSHALKDGDAKVRRAVIMIHGNLRNADSYFETAVKGVAKGCALKDTVVIAPHFQAKEDKPKADELRWSSGGWKIGEAAKGPKAPKKNSFEVIDHILKRIEDKFPKVKEVVIAGHSAGGQFVQRYAAGARLRTGLSIRYVVANPSSYMYLNDKRLKPGAVDTWHRPSGCAGYNTWKYGLTGVKGYLAKTGAAKIRSQYPKRKVVYFVGTKDTKRSGAFDDSCQADAQGRTRYARGYVMRRFMDAFYRGHRHRLYETVAGHSAGDMYTSTAGAALLTR